jgi:hypothetical protein
VCSDELIGDRAGGFACDCYLPPPEDLDIGRRLLAEWGGGSSNGARNAWSGDDEPLRDAVLGRCLMIEALTAGPSSEVRTVLQPTAIPQAR